MNNIQEKAIDWWDKLSYGESLSFYKNYYGISDGVISFHDEGVSNEEIIELYKNFLRFKPYEELVREIYPNLNWNWVFEPYISDDRGEMLITMDDGQGNSLIETDDCIIEFEEAWEKIALKIYKLYNI